MGEDLPLSPDRFLEQNLSPPTLPGQTVTVWHPVFVRGLDAPVDATTAALGCQGRTGGGRIAEEVEIVFGRPGDATVAQPVPSPDAGPGDGSWPVLVGFVQFDMAIGQFVKSVFLGGRCVGRRGRRRAGLVAGQFGRVELRGKPGQPTLGVAGARAGTPIPGPSLVFGTYSGTGTVAPLLRLDARATSRSRVPSRPRAPQAGRDRGRDRIRRHSAPAARRIDQATVDSGGVELFIS